jgi:hypothetical protein
VEGEAESYQALGDFGPAQNANGWTYEETADGEIYHELAWSHEGYEGFWAGSGLGRIGRIWMQPSAGTDLSRTFVVPRNGKVTVSGEVRKDPSAEQSRAIHVRILRNREQLWPVSDWASVPPFDTQPLRVQLDSIAVREGDRVRFVIRRNGENRAQPIIWNPSIVYQKGNS